MPHVIVKMLAGRSEQQKARLAEEVSQAVMRALGSGAASISVAIHDVPEADWTDKIYRPEILGDVERLYKKPGYDPLA